MNIMS